MEAVNDIEKVTITGGEGDDSIENKANNVTIDAGAGNDLIKNYGDSVTIDGGTGDDSISLSRNGKNILIYYHENEGNDIIQGLKADSTLQILADSVGNAILDGGDILLTVGQNTITLKNFFGLEELNIIDQNGDKVKIVSELDDYDCELRKGINIVALRGLNLFLKACEQMEELQDNDEESSADVPQSSALSLTEVPSKSASELAGLSTLKFLSKVGTAKSSVTEIIKLVNTKPETSADALNRDLRLVSELEKLATVAKDADGLGFLSSVTAFAGAYIATADGMTPDERDELFITGIDVAGEGLKLVAKFVPNKVASTLLEMPFGGVDLLTALAKSTYMSFYGNDDSDFWENFRKYYLGGLEDIFPKLLGLFGDNDFDPQEIFESVEDREMPNLINYGDSTEGKHIENFKPGRVIITGSGSDIIKNGVYEFFSELTSNVLISVGDGDNEVYSYGDNVVVRAGNGNNNIYLNRDEGYIYSITRYDRRRNHVVYVGNGKNYVDAGKNSVIYAGNGNNHLQARDNSRISAGSGNDRGGAGDNSVVYAGSGNNSMGVGSNSKIYAGDGDDTLWCGSNSQIYAGAGNNYIDRAGSDSKVYTGDGNDVISTWGDRIRIEAGNGNNSIYLGYTHDDYFGDNCQINTGSGNDYVSNIRGANVDIKTGGGNDTIYSGGYVANSPIGCKIDSGDGDDSIKNWGDDSTVDAGAGNDTIYSSGDSVTINAGAGDDYIYSSGDSITVDAGDGDNSISSSVWRAKINAGSGNDNISISALDLTLDSGNGNDSIKFYGFSGVNSSKASINVGGGDNYLYSSSNTVTVNGGSGENILELGALKVHVNLGNGNNLIKANCNSAVICVGSGNDFISVTGNSSDISIIDAGNGNNYIETGNYSSIVSGAGNDTIMCNESCTIEAGGGANYISSGAYSKIFAGIGDDIIYNTGEHSEIYANAGNDYIMNEGDNVLFKYQAGDGNDIIEGFKATSTLQIGDGSATYSATKNDLDVIVTVGDGKISLVGAASLENVNIVGEEIPVWTFDGVTAIYGTHKEILIALSGVKSTTGITINGSTVTLTENNLNEQTVTINDGYTLALAGDVTQSTITAAHFDGTTYKTASNTAGYTLKDNKVSYTEAKAATDLFKLTGVANTTGIEVDNENKTVTLTANNLNKTNVTINSGYSLKLASGIAEPKTTAAHFDGTTYKSASNTAGYSLKDNKVTYTEAKTATDLFKLTGVANTTGIEISGKAVTLNTSNLNKRAVTINKGYKLKLGSDVSKSATKTAGTFSKVKSGTATFKTNAYSDFYTLKNNKIGYTAAKASKEIKISGLKSSATLATVKKAITVAEKSDGSCTVTFNSADVLNSKAPTLTVPKGLTYKVAVSENLSKSTTTTAWTVSSTNASLKSSTSATYTVKNNKIVYTAQKVGAPQVVLSGLAKNVKAASISLPAKNILTLDAAILGTSTSLKSNDSGYSVKLTGNMKDKTFVGTSGADKFNVTATNAKVSGGAGKDSIVGGSGNDTLSGDAGNDTLTGGKGKDYLAGGAGADILLGGKGKDTLWGGAGNDTLYGGAGNDTFIYRAGDGKDKIFDYSSGDMLKILDGKFTKSKFSNGTLSLAIKGGGTVLFDGVANGDKFNINGKTYKISGSKLK